MKKNGGLSRRNFLLSGTSAITAGAVLAGGSYIIKSMIKSKATEVTAVGYWPYPIEGLDVELARQYGKEAYYGNGCGFASAFALVRALKEALGNGTIWDNLPVEMLKYGSNGAVGWGTLCGALNGSLAIITLACPDWSLLGNELMGWYTVTPLPTAIWTPPIQTVSGSPLCHVSVSVWSKAAGNAVNSPEKIERASMITGDTVAKAAELLNEYARTGSIEPVFEIPGEYANCVSCHNMCKNQVGKMNCVSCHEDHHTHGLKSNS